MEIKFIDLVDEFYQTIKDKYNISLEELRLVCKAPFIQLKNIISGQDIHDIRFKHLGVWKIHKQSIRNLLKKNQVSYDNHWITEDDYLSTKTKLENKLKENDNAQEDL